MNQAQIKNLSSVHNFKICNQNELWTWLNIWTHGCVKLLKITHHTFSEIALSYLSFSYETFQYISQNKHTRTRAHTHTHTHTRSDYTQKVLL